MDTRQPPRGAPRTSVLAAGAGLALTALLGTSVPAGADTYIDPEDRCLPDAEAPPAPVPDRDAIAPVHVQSVDCVFAEGISVGTADGTYDPQGMTRRDQMASFVVRALEAAGYEVPAAGDQGFADIAGNEHEANINALAALGIVEGRSASSYAPDEVVRRDQMASFMVRTVEFAYGEDDFALGADDPVQGFTDVPDSNVHAGNIEIGATVLGLLAGTTDTTYAPAAPVAREQMASYLVRVVDMTLVVE